MMFCNRSCDYELIFPGILIIYLGIYKVYVTLEETIRNMKFTDERPCN